MKSAFLSGDLEEEVYVEQPQGFEIQGLEGDVYLLKKYLYGLKQAPRAWYHKIDAFLLSLKISRTHADNNLYVLMVDDALCILVLYVDELLLTCSNMDLISWSTYFSFCHDKLGFVTLFSRIGSMATCFGHFPFTKEVCFQVAREI